jgi:hypothetical protein
MVFSEMASGNYLSKFKVCLSLLLISASFSFLSLLKHFLLPFLHCLHIEKVFSRKLPGKFQQVIWPISFESDAELATILFLRLKLGQKSSRNYCIFPCISVNTFQKDPVLKLVMVNMNGKSQNQTLREAAWLVSEEV